MHTAAFAALGLDASYEALDVPPAELGGAVAAFRSDETFLGANVTTPHKRAVMAHLAGLSPAATVVGAVNTLVPTEAGLVGDNTDVAGFTMALTARGAREPGGKAVVIGAGGAARAAVYALLTEGTSVTVAARSPRAAEELAADLAAHGDIRAVDAPRLASELGDATLLVNATTVGMVGGPAEAALPLDVDVRLLPAKALVYDLVYRPRLTPLLHEAEIRGLPTLDGLAMLVWQGAASLEAWTGRDAPVDAMLAAVNDAGAEVGRG